VIGPTAPASIVMAGSAADLHLDDDMDHSQRAPNIFTAACCSPSDLAAFLLQRNLKVLFEDDELAIFLVQYHKPQLVDQLLAVLRLSSRRFE